MDFRFLYRQSDGRIGRSAFIRAAAPLIAIFAVVAGLMAVLGPFAHRGLDARKLFDAPTLLANLTLLAATFVFLLAAVSWVNLAAKRFRDRGRPGPVGLAGALPFVLMVAGAAMWLQPRVAPDLPLWPFWTLVAAVALATLVELLDLSGANRR
ncbi:MAG: DUF805 domain-containing protein [Hyphomicrobiales bacterium]|nr:DUF805 domain-containing protein [Hyphomicrobiales bacterium]